jgi:hypothetical protein
MLLFNHHFGTESSPINTIRVDVDIILVDLSLELVMWSMLFLWSPRWVANNEKHSVQVMYSL